MDLLTQGVLGASIGQAFFKEQLGKKAIWIGALTGCIPDLDIISKWHSDPLMHLQLHRGFTHSLWFAFIAAVPIGYLIEKLGVTLSNKETRYVLYRLIFWALWTHPLLDVFTTYGTQLLAPFSSTRFCLHGVGIVDPLYTLPLLIPLLCGRYLSSYTVRRLSRYALCLTSAYLIVGSCMSAHLKGRVNQGLTEAGYSLVASEVYALPLQPFVRRSVVRMRQMNHESGEVDEFIWTQNLPVQFKAENVSQLPWKVEKLKWIGAANALRDRPEGKLFEWFTGDWLIPELHMGVDSENWVMLWDARYGALNPNGRVDALWGLFQKLDHQHLPVGPAFMVRGADLTKDLDWKNGLSRIFYGD